MEPDLNIQEFILAQIMYLLSEEDKYSSKLYHYIDDIGLEPIECNPTELDLKQMNKAEFSLLKRVNFDNLDIRRAIEEECERRKTK